MSEVLAANVFINPENPAAIELNICPNVHHLL